MRVPAGIRACLWSYHPSELDLEEDREIIIAQVLNYGRWRDVQWLFQTYSKETIKSVLKNPSRGSWLPETLNFWLTLWNMSLSKRRYKRALFTLTLTG